MANKYVPFAKFWGSFLVPILYIVSFASKTWVTTAYNTEWGLWAWCYTNFSDSDHAPDHVNDTARCHSISPGDSPGYYEAVRTVGTFTLVFHIAYFFTFNPNEGMGKDKKPVFVAFVAMVGAAATLAVLGDNYKNDERFQDDDPSLGWCYWLVTASAVLGPVMMWVSYENDEINKGRSTTSSCRCPRLRAMCPSSRPQRAPADPPPVITPVSPRRAPKTTVPRTTQPSGAASNGAGPSHAAASRGAEPAAPAQSSSRPRGREPESGRDAFPVLSLPRYDIAPEPDRDIPSAAPPSYEDVMREGGLSPPPPYVVTPSEAWRVE